MGTPTEELERLVDGIYGHWLTKDELRSAIQSYSKALETDARRYRWLRERYSAADMDYKDFGEGQTGRPVAIFSVTNPWPFSFDYEAAAKLLDAAIDAALSQEATVPREEEV